MGVFGRVSGGNAVPGGPFLCWTLGVHRSGWDKAAVPSFTPRPRFCAKIFFNLAFLRGKILNISNIWRYVFNAPIDYWKKVTIWKEACIVHVGAVIHDYQGETASWSIKCLWWKDCPGGWTSLNSNNNNFSMRSHPYQREASRPSGPGREFFSSF